MTDITISIEEGSVQRALDGICGFHGYQDEISDGEGDMIPNPENRGSFAKRMIIHQIKDWTIVYEKKQLAKEISITVQEDVSTNLIID